MLRCKPGDMAIIVEAPFEERVGVFCTVLRPAAPDDSHVDQRPHWLVKTMIPVPWYIGDDASRTMDHIGTSGCIADADMVPIRGQPEQTDEQVFKEIDRLAEAF